MRICLLALFALAILSACANIRDGIQKDTERMGDKMQAITQTLSEP